MTCSTGKKISRQAAARIPEFRAGMRYGYPFEEDMKSVLLCKYPRSELKTLWPSPKPSHFSVLGCNMKIRLIEGFRALAPHYDGFILDLWGVVHDGAAPL